MAPKAHAQSGNGTVVYTYDALGRVTSASYDNNTTITYSYDAAGNRIQQSVAIGAAPGTPPSPPPPQGLLPGSSQWTTNGSGIYYNGGNVGIGTTSPATNLEVRGTALVSTSAVTNDLGSATLTLGPRPGGGISTLHFETDNNNRTVIENSASAGGLGFINYNGGWIGNYQMFLSQAGNLGIGTVSPTATLHVTGNGQVKISSTTSAIPPHIYLSDGTRDFAAGEFGSIYRIRDFTAGGVDRLVIDGSGNVGIATAGPAYTLHVNGTAYAAGAAGALSDRRHKDKIRPLALDGLATVAKLKPVSFVWKEPKDDGMKGTQFGFVAQDVEKVLPQVVLTANNDEKTKGLKYDALIPVLTLAIQQLDAREQKLEAANEAQATEIDQLKAANDRQATELRALHEQIKAETNTNSHEQAASR